MKFRAFLVALSSVLCFACSTTPCDQYCLQQRRERGLAMLALSGALLGASAAARTYQQPVYVEPPPPFVFQSVPPSAPPLAGMRPVAPIRTPLEQYHPLVEIPQMVPLPPYNPMLNPDQRPYPWN